MIYKIKSNTIILYWTIFVSVFSILIVSGQNRTIEYYIKNGLEQKSGYAIYQDKNDIVWIASQVGIDAFDGVYFSHYPYKELGWGGYDHETTCFTEDTSNNLLWVGTGKGLGLINTSNYNAYRIDSTQELNILSMQVLSDDQHNYRMILSTDDEIFISTIDFNSTSPSITLKSVDTDSEVKNGFRDIVKSDHQYLIGSGNGLFSLEVSEPDSMLKAELVLWTKEENITAIHVEEIENEPFILVATESGVYKCDNEGKKPQLFFQNGGVNSICSKKDSIFLGTSDYIYVANSCRDYTPKAILGANHIRTLFIDQNGQLWIGTHGYGVSLRSSYVQDFKTWVFEKNRPSSSKVSNHVFAIWPDTLSNKNTNVAWIGTLGEGLIQVNYETGEIVSTTWFAKTDSNDDQNTGKETRIFHIEPDLTGDSLYVATGVGLFKVSRENPQELKNNPFFTQSTNWFHLDRESNKLYISAGKDGAYIYSQNVLSRIDFGENVFEVYYIGGGKDGEILLSTKTGVFKLGSALDTVPVRKENFSAIDNERVSHIYIDASNYWVATLGNGLY